MRLLAERRARQRQRPLPGLLSLACTHQVQLRCACRGSPGSRAERASCLVAAGGEAEVYLHLKDVYVSVGQGVSRRQTIGTAGKTGWTNFNPHLHFQRQSQGAWITNSQPVYFDEYPGQQLQQGQWCESGNDWPGDLCPTLAGAGWGYLGIVGAKAGRRIRRRRWDMRTLVKVLVVGFVVGGALSG